MNVAKRPCPVCGSENAESEFFCRNCGSDVSVAGTPPPAVVPVAGSPLPSVPPTPTQRVCSTCGYSNDPVLMLCTQCGSELIATSLATPKPARLFLEIGNERFECQDQDILGREGTVARTFFTAVGTVSRRHVTLLRRPSGWFLTVAPSARNLTQLDGCEVSRGVEQPLSGQHVLRLSTQCEVRLSVVEDLNANC